VFVSNAIPFDNDAAAAADLNPGAYRRTPDSTAAASDVITCTFPADEPHGFVTGQQVRLLGADSGFNGTAAVSAVTSTTVEFTVAGAGTGSSSSPGTLVAASAMIMLVSRARIFRAVQLFPTIRTVPLPNSSASSLQVYSLWGAAATPGSAVCLHSPPNAVA
jgi:hypothetical protein